MNAILQIIIVRSHQSITEIPGVLLKSIIIDAEAKSFHVFNHKNSGCSGVAFAEWMDLPNV